MGKTTNFFTKSPNIGPKGNWKPGTPRSTVFSVNFHGPDNIISAGEVGGVKSKKGAMDVREVNKGRKTEGTTKV